MTINNKNKDSDLTAGLPVMTASNHTNHIKQGQKKLSDISIEVHQDLRVPASSH